MPTMKLTDKLVSNRKPPESGRLELWDSLLPGFGLRVTDKNARTYFVMYRALTAEGRKQRRLKIGDAAIVSLGEAREAAREALRKVAHGVDPAEDKGPSNVAAVGNVRAAAADYLERYVKKNTRPGTFKETKRTFDVDVLPVWGARPVGSITRQDVGKLLDTIAGRGAEVQANRTLTRLKTFFSWLLDEEVISVSPVARMKPRTRALKLKGGEELPRLVPEFILHDLRRTAATGMARLNIAPHVVDKVLNHTGGAIRGVAAVYNRFEYSAERRAALEAWGRYIDNLLAPQSNVIELRA
jgi:hypothetical protein